MRVFVAVDLPDAVRDGVARTAGLLRARLAGVAGHSRITWVATDRLHLTVLFVGEVPPAVAHDIVTRLETPLAVRSFTLSTGALGFFPEHGRPRVAWLAIDEGAQGLAVLHGAVRDRLDGVPFRREDRSFSPHLTLARFGEPGFRGEREALAATTLPPCGRGLVDRVTLYESGLSPRGPDYRALAVTPLLPETAA